MVNRRTPDNKVAPATIRSQACSAVMERKQRLVGMSQMGYSADPFIAVVIRKELLALLVAVEILLT
jgi:hypothetical protein